MFENTNYANGELVTYANGYSYFIADFYDDSYGFNIVRIGDAPDALPEIIYSDSLTYDDDMFGARSYGLSLTVYDNKLYLFQCDYNNSGEFYSYKISLRWVSLDGKNSGVMDLNYDLSNDLLELLDVLSIDCDELIFFTVTSTLKVAPTQNGVMYFASAYVPLQVDLNTGQIKDFADSTSYNGEFRFFWGLYGGYVYYCKTIGAYNYSDFAPGIYRMKLTDNKEEDVCALSAGEIELLIQDWSYTQPLFVGGYMYYITDDSDNFDYTEKTLTRIDIETGEKKWIFDYYCNIVQGTINITQDTIYYFDGPDLYRCDLDGGNKTLLVEEMGYDIFGKWCMHISGDWIYYYSLYSDASEPGFFRVSRTTDRIFPTEPLWR